jgi:hypothetical protein
MRTCDIASVVFLCGDAISPFMDWSSLAASGGAVMAVLLAGTMAAAVLGSWGTLKIVDRWR